MQLANKTVTASGRSVEASAAGAGTNQRGSVACRRPYAPVLVRGFYGRAVKDKEDQQQTEPAFQAGALVLNCVNQHAGHCRMC
jgi:hypothetical protein